MTERFDLAAVNHALRELTRLQLCGELDAETAWRERREIMLGVESEWEALAALERPEPVAEPSEAEAAAPVEPVTRPAPAQRVQGVLQQVWLWLWQRSWRMPLWIMLLALALMTFFYVGSL